MPRLLIANGTRFGHLVVIGDADSTRSSEGVVRRRMLCKCDCGNTVVSYLSNVRSGHTTSCGCVGQSAGRKNKTHGLAGTKVYRAWTDMIQRCYNKERKRFGIYGGRGITVCQRWRDSFESFVEDMGEPPTPSHSIDRIDNSLGYCKANCQWATRHEQARNTRRNVFIEFNGTTKCLQEWSEIIGIKYGTLYDRLKSGWSIEKAFTTAVCSRGQQ